MYRISANKIFYACLGFCYFIAFYSVYQQYPGLFSVNGLLPVGNMIANIRSHFGFTDDMDLFAKFHSISLLSETFGVTIDALNESILILGTFLSAFAMIGNSGILIFATLWYLYFNVFFFGQTFLSFQWDILLLEVGFLGVLSLLSTYFLPSALGASNWCYRFLAFKLMFLAGIVKLQSRCPTWENLTALDYHFAGQPIPTPLSWFFEQLPPIFLRAGVAFTLVVEILVAVCLLAPSLTVRRLAVALQVLLQVIIALSGNYNFFNLLTALLMLKVWESDKSVMGKIKLLEVLCVLFFVAFVFYSASNLLAIESGPATTSMEWWRGERLVLRMKWDELLPYMYPTCLAAVVGTMSQIVLQTTYSIFTAPLIPNRYSKKTVGFGRRLLKSAGLVVVAIVSCSWVVISSIPLTKTCGVKNLDFLLPPAIINIDSVLSSWHVVSGYGLFRRMTGVGAITSHERQIILERGSSFSPSIVERPELVIEGFDGVTATWHELPFRYKPGELYRAPSFIAPLQPRLDWQMWFAALGSYEHNPWLVHLLHKLLESPNNAAVRDLLDTEHFPASFARSPPKFVRVLLYDYAFTHLNTSWARLIPRAHLLSHSTGYSNEWWTRYNMREYIPPLEANNPSVKGFLEAHRLYTPSEVAGLFSRVGSGDIPPRDLYRICVERRSLPHSGAENMERSGQPRAYAYAYTSLELLAESVRKTVCSSVLLRDRELWSRLQLNAITMDA